MATKTKATLKSRRSFNQNDVKALYKAIEWDDREAIETFALAASGSFKVHRRFSGSGTYGSSSGNYSTEFWPMELVINKGDLELLEILRPHVDVIAKIDNVHGSWMNVAWYMGRLSVVRTFLSWVPQFRDEDGQWLAKAAVMNSMNSMDFVELVLPISNPLGKDKEGTTALMAAAAGLRVDAVKRLLPLSDPNAVDDQGRDALMYAIDGQLGKAGVGSGGGYANARECACFQSLIDACGVDRLDANGKTAVSRAIQKSENEHDKRQWKSIPSQLTELLFAAGGQPDGSSGAGLSMMMGAIEVNDRMLFAQLLGASSWDLVDDEGFTPLLKAAKLGRSGMVAGLAPLSNCDRQGPEGMTALMWAIKHDDLASVRLLQSLTNRALRDVQGRTAVMIAAENVTAVGSEQARSFLIFLRLFEPDHAKGQGILPWLVGIDEFFEAALPYCDPNDTIAGGLNALHRAIELGKLDAFNILLPLSDTRTTDDHGTTALMMAIKKKDMVMFKTLLPHSDVAAIDDKGWTALMWAVDGRQLEMVAALMPGSDPDAVDRLGKNALLISMEGWNPDEELIKFLAERTDLSKISQAGRAQMILTMSEGGFPEEMAKKLRGMMNARNEKDEILGVLAKPQKPVGKTNLARGM